MTTIVCYDPHGQPVLAAANTLTFSPAAYGIFIDNHDILLIKDAANGWMTWPGAVLQVGERPCHVISRTYHQLTGIIPVVGPLLFMEDLYQVDSNGRAWHISAMFYWVERPSATAISLNIIDANHQPQMITADLVQRSQLQFGYQALQAGLHRLKTA